MAAAKYLAFVTIYLVSDLNPRMNKKLCVETALCCFLFCFVLLFVCLFSNKTAADLCVNLHQSGSGVRFAGKQPLYMPS